MKYVKIRVFFLKRMVRLIRTEQLWPTVTLVHLAEFDAVFST